MNSQEVGCFKRSPEEFQQLILAYQSQRNEIDALLLQQRQLQRTIESKFGVNNLNVSYEFPRAQEDSFSRQSSHPSLLTSNFNLNSFAKKVIDDSPALQQQPTKTSGTEHLSQPRRIMNVRDVRQIVRNNNPNKENDEHDKQLTGRTIDMNDSPKSTKRQIKSISKDLIKEIKSYEGRVTGGGLQPRNFNESINRTDKKLNIELSIDRQRKMLTDRRQHTGVETPKTLEPMTGGFALRKIQSFKNIVQSNRKQQEKTQQSQAQSSAAVYKDSCLECPVELAKKPKVRGIHKANLNLFVQRREIKIVTAGKLNKSGDELALDDRGPLKHSTSQMDIGSNPIGIKPLPCSKKPRGLLAGIGKQTRF